MKRILALAACLFIQTGTAQLKDLSGAWKITTNEGIEKTVGLKYFADSNKVLLLDSASFKSVQSDVNASKISFLIGKQQFQGRVEQDSIWGTTAVSGGGSSTWSAVRVGSVWMCNHNPAHYAATKEEMLALTASKQCSGWHRGW